MCGVGPSQYGLQWGGRVNPIDFQRQTQHLTASNIRFVFLSEEVICYFETVAICLVLHILLSLIKDVHSQALPQRHVALPFFLFLSGFSLKKKCSLCGFRQRKWPQRLHHFIMEDSVKSVFVLSPSNPTKSKA